MIGSTSVLKLYHGTSKTYSNIITETGFELPPVKRVDHWLGNGIYFFREDDEQALIWAVTKFKKYSEETEAHVLETVIQIPDENFLNLDTRGGLRKFKSFLGTVEKHLKGVKFTDEPDKLRHFIMNMLPSKYTVVQRTFDVKKSFEFERHPLLKAMELHLHGVQVCVRDKTVITGDINVVQKRTLFHGYG